MDSSSQKRFKTISYLEGLSFLLLLGIAMPLKYMAGLPAAVKYVGWAHGLLFILYVFALFELRREWSTRKLGIGFVASLLPFGPFLFERFSAKLAAENAELIPVQTAE